MPLPAGCYPGFIVTASNKQPALVRFHRLLVVIWGCAVAGVAVASLLPASNRFVQAYGRLPLSDKGLHFSVYAGLSFLAAFAWGTGRRLVFALVFLAAMGLLLEFGQKLSPGRTTDMGDFAANVAGIAIGALAAWVARAVPGV